MISCKTIAPLIAPAAASCIAAACDPEETPVCDPGESRCSGDLVEVCDPEGQWETRYDCQEYDVTCRECPEGPTCGECGEQD